MPQVKAIAVALVGANGAGKTNLLEAVSMLVPGRGLRGARLGELACRGARPDGVRGAEWAVAARIDGPAGPADVGTGWQGVDETDPDDGDGERRPTRKGLCLRVERLPELLEALRKAEEEARKAGLLE